MFSERLGLYSTGEAQGGCQPPIKCSMRSRAPGSVLGFSTSKAGVKRALMLITVLYREAQNSLLSWHVVVVCLGQGAAAAEQGLCLGCIVYCRQQLTHNLGCLVCVVTGSARVPCALAEVTCARSGILCTSQGSGFIGDCICMVLLIVGNKVIIKRKSRVVGKGVCAS